MPFSGNMYLWDKGVKNAPERAGVYALYDKDRTLIYIGGSTNLRETFTNYYETNFTESPNRREARYYKREVVSNWEGRVKELLNEYRKKYKVPTKEVALDLGFHFYEDTDKPLYEVALNLEDFWETIQKVPVAALEFHRRRGDFARWIREVFKEIQLAERIERIYHSGEELREELLNSLLALKMVECPECGVHTCQVKTWKMAGRPHKTGEKLQLTIGLYKCNNCKKTFRKVVKKDMIKAE